MATTPTSIINRLMGLEALTDALNFSTVAQTLAAGTTLGGMTLDDANRLVTVAGATTTLSLTKALHSGKIVLLASTAGLVITPPAATGTGSMYTLLVTTTISGGSVTIDAKLGQASDIVSGRAYQMLVGTGLSAYAAGATDNLITLNGTTTGGLKGDRVVLIDVATHLWYVWIDSTATGSVATPFSNH